MALLKVFVLPVLALLAGAISAPAAAHGSTTAYAAGQGSVNRIEVGIDVRASVSDRCGFATDGAPSGTLSQTEFDRTGFSKDFAIRLNCTSASRIAVSSLNGGLAQGETVTGYASNAPYNVELKMVGDNGTNAGATCAASLLKAGAGCAFGGSASTTNGLRLGAPSTKANGSYVRVSAQPYTDSKPLLAGNYSDTLTITISIAP